MTLDERIARGKAASVVLENAAYIEAWTKIVGDIRGLRLQLSPRDAEGAYRLVLMEQAVERSKRLMESYLQDAESARKELEKPELPGPIGRMNRRFQQIIR